MLKNIAVEEWGSFKRLLLSWSFALHGYAAAVPREAIRHACSCLLLVSVDFRQFPYWILQVYFLWYFCRSKLNKIDSNHEPSNIQYELAVV